MVPSTPGSSTKADPGAQEVRVALTLNGGVSLAIWMGGCAVELDCARRSHLSAEGLAAFDADSSTGKLEVLGEVLTGQHIRADQKAAEVKPPRREVYNCLCRAFERELVIDILSGASAGGINGALLAAAIQHRRRLHPDFLRQQWLQLGDFAELLHPMSEEAPRSLMRGDLFLRALRDVFRAVIGTRNASREGRRMSRVPNDQSALERGDAKLDVTTTNVVGEPRSVKDYWGEDLFAREYRARFKFRARRSFTPDNLAAAARSSAAFPVAFEPHLIKDDELMKLAGFSQPRWVIDGGLLDNAPLTTALELIPLRRSEREVERFVCYVNADPPEAGSGGLAPEVSPPIPDVLGYVVNLPRNAPFVNHIEALLRAKRQATVARDTEPELLTMDLNALKATAKAILGSYGVRRRLLAFDELLGGTGDALWNLSQLKEAGVNPPPFSIDPPFREATWNWGIRTGERVIHLLLDVFRTSIELEEDREAKAKLLAARVEIHQRLEELAALRDLVGPARESVDSVIDAVTGYDTSVFKRVCEAVKSAYPVADLLEPISGVSAKTALFGPNAGPTLGDPELDTFLQKALSIEVLRRAFAPEGGVDSGQKLRFAQLTPSAPCPLLSANPLSDEGPSTAEEKLTGIKLGHFAAFYRHSWRANDFMWGRLDAAARIVQILVEPARADHPTRDPTLTPAWEVIGECLLPDGATPEQCWLILEALRDAESDDGNVRDEVREVVSGSPVLDDENAPAEALRQLLIPTLAADLDISETRHKAGVLTRAVCTRAVQLEILAHELPHVVQHSQADEARGTLGRRLPFEPVANRETIESLRTPNQTLPGLLGRDLPEEPASRLALRTITHAVFVALAAFRESKIPLAGLLNVTRAPMLAVAGTVARGPAYRFAAAVGFAVAAFYLTGRILSIDPSQPLNLDLRGFLALALTLVAAFSVLGVAGVAFIRGRRRQGFGKVTEYLWAIALASSGGILALVLWFRVGGVGVADLITGPDAIRPHPAVSSLLLAIVLGLSVARVPVIGRQINELVKKPWGGLPAMILLAGAAGVLVYFTAGRILESLLGHEPWYEHVSAWATLAALPIALGYVFVRDRLAATLRRWF